MRSLFPFFTTLLVATASAKPFGYSSDISSSLEMVSTDCEDAIMVFWVDKTKTCCEEIGSHKEQYCHKKAKERKKRKGKTDKGKKEEHKLVSDLCPDACGVSVSQAPTPSPLPAGSMPTDEDAMGRELRTLADLRFNKCPPIADENRASNSGYTMGVHTSIFPLMPKDYPVSGETATVLQEETMADAVVTTDDYQLVQEHNDPSYWMDRMRTRPFFPGDPEFWDELRDVVEAQIARRRGDAPSSRKHWPSTWDDKVTLEDIAQAVAGEYPALHQATAIEKFYAEGLEMNAGMNPFRSANDFISRQVRLSSINAWAFEIVAPVSFMMKWQIGMPRPEEVVWLIHTGEFTPEADGVPEDLVALIRSMDLESALSFTAYGVGSPMHPSFPAMHSSGSTLSYWLPVVAEVTPEQWCLALRVDYATAMARTTAGVHYKMDNIAGLNLGQAIVQRNLPTMLHEKYGYDVSALEAKLEILSFDWGGFDAYNCTIGGESTADILARL